MSLDDLPLTSAWRHEGAREGFEAVTVRRLETGGQLEGASTAVQAGEAWAIAYRIAFDARWVTRQARIWGWSTGGSQARLLESDGAGRWRVDGRDQPALDGCLDVDLEASASTNTLPVHRLGLEVGAASAAPAAYVRAVDFGVERLEQTYTRLEDDGPRRRYMYRAPVFEFQAVLAYDRAGLVLDYPGIATRAL